MEIKRIHNEFIPWAPWNTPVSQSKVALVSTGGVYLLHGLHQPYESGGDFTFREFPSVVESADLGLAEGGFDASYGRQDVNALFPLDRLKELAEAGYIGAVASMAYSFATRVSDLEAFLANSVISLAYRMKRMGPDVALLVACGEAGHQTVALAARAIELAGVPTVVLGTDKEALLAAGTPRMAVVQHPVGAPLGNPGNSGKHQQVLREVLSATWEFEGPGLVAELPYRWSGQ